MPSAAEARSLFRAFLRVGNKFSNYNIRECVKGRLTAGIARYNGVTADTAGNSWRSALCCPYAFIVHDTLQITCCRYVKRRAGERFREAAAVTDADALAQLWQRARAELEVAQRQAQVYALYARSQPSIMDLETRHRQH
eukprot:scaffold3.g6177.t1